MRPIISRLYEESYQLIDLKAHDYAREDDPHSNFKFSEQVEKIFPHPYKSYAVLIGTKLARIAELLNKAESNPNIEPSNEPLIDSFKDAINYLGLMYERYCEETDRKVPDESLDL